MSLRNPFGTHTSFLCSHSFLEALEKSAGLSATKWKPLFWYCCCGPQSAQCRISPGISWHLSLTLSRVWGSLQCHWRPHLLLYQAAASHSVQSSIPYSSHEVKTALRVCSWTCLLLCLKILAWLFNRDLPMTGIIPGNLWLHGYHFYFLNFNQFCLPLEFPWSAACV